MIKYNIKELIAKKEFDDKRSISISEVAEEVKISRITLSRLANARGDYSTKTEYIEKLCKYFNCSVADIMTIVPDED